VLRVVSRWILTLCAVPSILLGQSSDIALKEGDRVWISAQSSYGFYIVRAVSSDTLTVKMPSSDSLVTFPVATLRRVEVSRRPADPSGRLMRRSSIGLLIGAVAGDVVAQATGNDPSAVVTKGDLVFIGSATGFIIGCVSGLNSEWKRVPLPLRVGTSTSGHGVLALSYHF
jgi:hypothetical protein